MPILLNLVENRRRQYYCDESFFVRVVSTLFKYVVSRVWTHILLKEREVVKWKWYFWFEVELDPGKRHVSVSTDNPRELVSPLAPRTRVSQSAERIPSVKINATDAPDEHG